MTLWADAGRVFSLWAVQTFSGMHTLGHKEFAQLCRMHPSSTRAVQQSVLWQDSATYLPLQAIPVHLHDCHFW